MLVYSATNRTDGKVYVGATRYPTLKPRRAQHKSRAFSSGDRRYTPLYEAIREHGWEAFQWEILEECSDKDGLYAAERKWIACYQSACPERGYNLTLGAPGSIGYEPSEETRKKIGEAGRGRVVSQETRDKRSAALKGRKPSPATMRALIGRKLSDETRKKIAAAKIGKKITWSDEARKRNAEGARRRSEQGVNAKIPRREALTVLARRTNGETLAQIAASYGVTPSAVCYFCKRHSADGVSP